MIHGSFLIPSARLRGEISPVARIHYTTPDIGRLADVIIDNSPSSADKLTQIPPPPKLDEEHVDIWGDRDVRASLNDFYQLRYGDYVIAMNTTEEDTYREQIFQVQEPENLERPIREVRDLISGEMIDLTKPVKVEPRSTVILYLGD